MKIWLSNMASVNLFKCVVTNLRVQFCRWGRSWVWRKSVRHWLTCRGDHEARLLPDCSPWNYVVAFGGDETGHGVLHQTRGVRDSIPRCCLVHSYSSFCMNLSLFLEESSSDITWLAMVPRIYSRTERARKVSILVVLLASPLSAMHFARIRRSESSTPGIITARRERIRRELIRLSRGNSAVDVRNEHWRIWYQLYGRVAYILDREINVWRYNEQLIIFQIGPTVLPMHWVIWSSLTQVSVCPVDI